MCFPSFFEGVVSWVLALCFYNFRWVLGCYRKLLLFGTFCLLLFGRRALFLYSNSMIRELGNCYFINSYFWFLLTGSIQGFSCWVLFSFRVKTSIFDSQISTDLGVFWPPRLRSRFKHYHQLRVFVSMAGFVIYSGWFIGAPDFSSYFPSLLIMVGWKNIQAVGRLIVGFLWFWLGRPTLWIRC